MDISGGGNVRTQTLHKASTMTHLPTLSQGNLDGIKTAAKSLSPTARLAQSLSPDVLARAGISRLDLENIEGLIECGKPPRVSKPKEASVADEDDDDDLSIESDVNDGNSEFSVS